MVSTLVPPPVSPVAGATAASGMPLSDTALNDLMRSVLDGGADAAPVGLADRLVMRAGLLMLLWGRRHASRRRHVSRPRRARFGEVIVDSDAHRLLVENAASAEERRRRAGLILARVM